MGRRVPDTDGYYLVAASEEVLENKMLPVKAGKRQLIVTRLDGELIAIDRHCPHAAADLTKGSLSRNKLCCHDHDYCFDLTNGRLLWPDDEPYRLRRYEVIEENGQVRVRVD